MKQHNRKYDGEILKLFGAEFSLPVLSLLPPTPKYPSPCLKYISAPMHGLLDQNKAKNHHYLNRSHAPMALDIIRCMSRDFGLPRLGLACRNPYAAASSENQSHAWWIVEAVNLTVRTADDINVSYQLAGDVVIYLLLVLN